jgi:hypothetical protein
MDKPFDLIKNGRVVRPNKTSGRRLAWLPHAFAGLLSTVWSCHNLLTQQGGTSLKPEHLNNDDARTA